MLPPFVVEQIVKEGLDSVISEQIGTVSVIIEMLSSRQPSTR